jgi:hypothetical protein
VAIENEDVLRKKFEDEIINTIRAFWDKSLDELIIASNSDSGNYSPIEELVEHYSQIVNNKMANNAIQLTSLIEDTIIESKKENFSKRG